MTTADARGGSISSAVRDWLVVTLAVTTGAADVTTFLVLGKVFSSVITGNLVLLGLAAGDGGAAGATHAGLAVAAYGAGVLAGTVAGGRGQRKETWPAAVTAALGLELGLLIPFAVVWEAAGHAGSAQLAMLSLLAAALGVQTGAVRQLGQMSSTYLTSTFAGLVAGLTRYGSADGRRRGIGVILALIGGAAAAAVLLRTHPAAVPALIVAPLATVVGYAAVLAYRGGDWR